VPLLQTIFQPMMTVRGLKADAAERKFQVKATGGGFLANLLGMGSKATLTMDEHGFRLNKLTFGSDEKVFIPRPQIASTVYVIMKPVELLVLGLMTLPIGIGLVLLIVYFFARRRVIIGVVSTGGTVESVKLKANDDELAEIREGMAVVEELIRVRPGAESEDSGEERPPRRLSEPSRGASAPAAAPASAPGVPRIVPCPSCGTRMSIPPSAVGRKVRCGSCREVFSANGE
jgi:predicted Zn finger-like uncharacterized protein